MLRAGMRVGCALDQVSGAVPRARAPLPDAVGVWCCAFPPVNWRAIFVGPPPGPCGGPMSLGRWMAEGGCSHVGLRYLGG